MKYVLLSLSPCSLQDKRPTLWGRKIVFLAIRLCLLFRPALQADRQCRSHRRPWQQGDLRGGVLIEIRDVGFVAFGAMG